MVLVGNKNDIRENRNVKVENETDADRRDRLLQRLKTAASLATSTVTSKDASPSSTTSLKTRIGSSESSSSSAPSWKKLTKFIENRKSPYIEASAKTGENVHKAFEMLVDAILARKLRPINCASWAGPRQADVPTFSQGMGQLQERESF